MQSLKDVSNVITTAVIEYVLTVLMEYIDILLQLMSKTVLVLLNHVGFVTSPLELFSW